MGTEKAACYTCGAVLKSGDYSHGRAISLLGRQFCEKCLERAMELSRPGARSSAAAHQKKGETHVPPPNDPEDPFQRSPEEMEELRRRTEERKAPPWGCDLYLRKSGIRGLFGGNCVRLWLDVSWRGGRAVLEGYYSVGDPLSLLIVHNGWGRRIEVAASVRHVSPSEQYPGSSLVGFNFENRSPALDEFLKKLVDESGGSSPSQCLKGKLA